VVTDEQVPCYGFPSARMEPEQILSRSGDRYQARRAAIASMLPAGTLAGGADLKLGNVTSLAPQLSSGEWLNSLRRPTAKAFLTMCGDAHLRGCFDVVARCADSSRFRRMSR